MDLHPEHYTDYLHHYQYVNINDLQSANTTKVNQAPYVLVSHITGIKSTSAFGLVVHVEDHTGNVTLALSGDAAFCFYEEHIRRPDHLDPITHPYALNDTWYGTYLFRIDSTTQIRIGSDSAFIVTEICMTREIVDRFFHYQMSEYESICYRRSKATSVLCGCCNGNGCVPVSPHAPRFLRLGMGTRKRAYAPYM